jgi:large subunit ribosomal protein L31e
MAKPAPKEPKIELEREYIVPLRKGWLKVPKYKRANKAIKTLKEFIVNHMKIYDGDLRKVKVDNLVNNEIRFRGMRKPLSKIKVQAKKYDNDTVRVELIEIPAHVKFSKAREEKKKAELDKKLKEKPKVEAPEEPVAKTEESEETKEKEQASKEEGLKIAKNQAKEMKHTSKDKKVIVQRKALAK